MSCCSGQNRWQEECSRSWGENPVGASEPRGKRHPVSEGERTEANKNPDISERAEYSMKPVAWKRAAVSNYHATTVRAGAIGKSATPESKLFHLRNLIATSEPETV